MKGFIEVTDTLGGIALLNVADIRVVMPSIPPDGNINTNILFANTDLQQVQESYDEIKRRIEEAL